MKLSELERSEQLVLIGLVRLMIQLDRQFSAGEEDQLKVITDELGEELFWDLAKEAADMMQGEEAVKYYARLVDRREAQTLIYGVLFDLAVPGTIVKAESQLLDWLKETWKFQGAEDPYR